MRNEVKEAKRKEKIELGLINPFANKKIVRRYQNTEFKVEDIKTLEKGDIISIHKISYKTKAQYIGITKEIGFEKLVGYLKDEEQAEQLVQKDKILIQVQGSKLYTVIKPNQILEILTNKTLLKEIKGKGVEIAGMSEKIGDDITIQLPSEFLITGKIRSFYPNLNILRLYTTSCELNCVSIGEPDNKEQYVEGLFNLIEKLHNEPKSVESLKEILLTQIRGEILNSIPKTKQQAELNLDSLQLTDNGFKFKFVNIDKGNEDLINKLVFGLEDKGYYFYGRYNNSEGYSNISFGIFPKK